MYSSAQVKTFCSLQDSSDEVQPRCNSFVRSCDKYLIIRFQFFCDNTLQSVVLWTLYFTFRSWRLFKHHVHLQYAYWIRLQNIQCSVWIRMQIFNWTVHEWHPFPFPSDAFSYQSQREHSIETSNVGRRQEGCWKFQPRQTHDMLVWILRILFVWIWNSPCVRVHGGIQICMGSNRANAVCRSFLAMSESNKAAAQLIPSPIVRARIWLDLRWC